MTVYVFLGPTLAVDEARRELDAVYLPPVAQGDVYRVALRKPRAIGIVDGYFERTPAVWHKEILWTLSRSIEVFGSASIGALRAAELAPFGMEGVGAIFADYLEGRLEDDDAVAVTHGPEDLGFPATSEPLVNIERTLSAAQRDGVLSPRSCGELKRIAKALFYPDRSYSALLARGRDAGLPLFELDDFRTWLPHGRVDQKRADALEMLRLIRSRLEDSCVPKPVRFHFEHTHYWDQARRLAGELHVDEGGRADSVPLDLLLDELRLEGRYESALRETLLRVLALERVERDGIASRRGLDGRIETGDEALLRLMESHLRAQLFGELPETLRRSGDYARTVVRAREKQLLLERRGLGHVSPEAAGLTSEGLVEWYFGQRLGEPVPPDLADHARRAGFADTVLFERAVLREYLYCDALADHGLGGGAW